MALACDLGSLELDPASNDGGRLPVALSAARIEVGLDGPWQICRGSVQRWSADVDLIDATLGTHDDDAKVHLYLYRDELELELACKNTTGCYHTRPPGPETIERLSEMGPDAIYWLPFERLETQWSVDLPEYLRHGIAYALTDRSCSRDVRPLDEVLVVSDEQGLNLGQSRATGQWIRMLLRDFGPARLETFATKLDSASSPEFSRAVFTEVYGLSMDASWARAAEIDLVETPGGWCRAPALPPVDPGQPLRLFGALECSDGQVEGHFDGHLERRHRLVVDAPSRLVVEGELGEGLDLQLDACGCGTTPSQSLRPGDELELAPGVHRLRLRSHTPVYSVDEGSMATPDLEFDLELSLSPV